MPQLTINLFLNVNEYLAQARDNASDVLTLVDPDLSVFEVAAFPTESNLVGLSVSGVSEKYTPHIFIALSSEKPMQLYAQATAL